jgi:hypothetical protein
VYHKLVDNLGLFHELQARKRRSRARRAARLALGGSRRLTPSRALTQGPVYPRRAAPRPPGLETFTRAGGVDVLGLDAWPPTE